MTELSTLDLIYQVRQLKLAYAVINSLFDADICVLPARIDEDAMYWCVGVLYEPPEFHIVKTTFKRENAGQTATMSATSTKNPVIRKGIKDSIAAIVIDNSEQQIKEKIEKVYGSDIPVPHDLIGWYNQFRKVL